MPKTDVWVMAIVTFVTIFSHNLAVAVLIGIIISALNFTWQKANKMSASTETNENEKVYFLDGPLFFGSVSSFEQLLDIKNDPKQVILDLSQCNVKDMSALQSLNKVTAKYSALDKELLLRNLSPDSLKLIRKSDQSKYHRKLNLASKKKKDTACMYLFSVYLCIFASINFSV